MKVAVTYYDGNNDRVKVMQVDDLTPPSDNPEVYGLDPDDDLNAVVVLEDGQLIAWGIDENGDWSKVEGE